MRLGNFLGVPGRQPGVTTGPRRLVGAVAAALAVVLVVSSCAGEGETSSPAGVKVIDQGSDGFHGAVIDPPYALPDVTLEDTEGTTVGLEDVLTPVTVVFFGYTHCPDVCNMQMADVAAAMRRMEDEPREKVSVVFITTDPERDDAAALTKYLDRFDEFDSFVGLTGDMEQISDAAESLGVALTGRTDLEDGGYEVGHGSQLIGFGPEGTGRLVWTTGTRVGDLREDITALAQQA